MRDAKWTPSLVIIFNNLLFLRFFPSYKSRMYVLFSDVLERPNPYA